MALACELAGGAGLSASVGAARAFVRAAIARH
jgi:hydroxymethylpyrimidine/phosphomethylpyrimidine kinase